MRLILLLLALQDTAFTTVVEERFAAWDTDTDGRISSKELDKLVTDPAVKGTEAAAVAAIKRSERSRKVELPPLTKAFLKDADAAGRPAFEKTYAEGLRKIRKASRELFEEGMPSLDAFHQGRLGDCFVLAPIAALVHRDREAVRKMIVPREDGGYDIAFPKKAVKVAALTDAELVLTSGTEGGGIWLNVLEKAVATAKKETLPDAEEKESVTDLIAHGGATKATIRLLTGVETKGYQIRPKGAKDRLPSDEQIDGLLPKLRETMKSLAEKKRIVCGGTPEKPGVPGIAGRHAYAVLGYDAESDALDLFNPWGNNHKPKGPPGLENGYATRDGRFRVPLREFVKIFGGGSYEGDGP